MDHMTDNSVGVSRHGTQRLVTYFAVNDAGKAIEFYRETLGAQVLAVFDDPDGRVMHAELRLGDAVFEIGEPTPEYGTVGPPAEGNNFTITYWTSDVDAVFDRLVAGGATVMSPVADVFSGDRMGVVRCPLGVRWCIARHDRDVPFEEIAAAAREWSDSQG
jgi:PhnB protein